MVHRTVTSRLLPARPLASAMLLLAALVPVGLLAVGAYAPLWYDESNYLTLALSIRKFGYLFSFLCGYFAFEFVQIRMDLPLAALSFVIVVLVALIRSKETDQSNWAALVAVLVLSSLAILTKYQAVCLTAALAIDTLVAVFL